MEYLRALRLSNQEPSSPEASPAEGVTTGEKTQEGEKRRSSRYRCSGSVEFRAQGSSIRTWGTVSDISRGGCYVEMAATFPADSPVEMLIEVNGTRIEVNGTVRVSYPYLGMGVEFTEIAPEHKERLDGLLRAIGDTETGPAAALPAEPDTAEVDASSIADPAGLLKAITEYFLSNSSLSKKDFYNLVQQHRSRTP